MVLLDGFLDGYIIEIICLKNMACFFYLLVLDNRWCYQASSYYMQCCHGMVDDDFICHVVIIIGVDNNLEDIGRRVSIIYVITNLL
jgi:hypothetical protein